MIPDKLSPLDLPTKISGYGKTPVARLCGLTTLFMELSNEVSAGGTVGGQLKKLSARDIDLLKEVIHSEVEKTSVKNPGVVSDQILFLFMGAIQIRQDKSGETWPLVYQSIQDFLKPPPSNKIALIGIAATLIIGLLGAGLFYAISRQPSVIAIKNQAANTNAVNVVGPATLGVLVSIYNQMKGGECQLPQAGLLPPEQMNAYLTFINEGIVNVADVDNLKLALRYATCLYPQKLMYAPL